MAFTDRRLSIIPVLVTGNRIMLLKINPSFSRFVRAMPERWIGLHATGKRHHEDGRTSVESRAILYSRVRPTSRASSSVTLITRASLFTTAIVAIQWRHDGRNCNVVVFRVLSTLRNTVSSSFYRTCYPSSLLREKRMDERTNAAERSSLFWVLDGLLFVFRCIWMHFVHTIFFEITSLRV